jgi:hypothetical protein
MAVAARDARRAASYRGGAAYPHPEDGCGESPLGATPRHYQAFRNTSMIVMDVTTDAMYMITIPVTRS